MLPVQQFISFIQKHQLFNVNDTILLGVSGGKDSVLMAHLFKLANFKFSIAHCNFNLRGEEAKRDEHFVKLLAKSLGVEFSTISFDTKGFALNNGISTQMAARALRYEWFEKIRIEGGYDFIALAQHQNDSLETVLLNLTRGTGISGLHGILPKRDNLIRPLLFLTRQQIDEYVNDNKIAFVEDSSNETDKYARNNIRLNVVPHLRDINPHLEQTFAENIERFAATEEAVEILVSEVRNRVLKQSSGLRSISFEDIKLLKPQNLLFYELLRPFQVKNDLAKEILNAIDHQAGASFYSDTHQITIDRSAILISVLPQANKTETMLIHHGEQLVRFNERQISIKTELPGVYQTDLQLAAVDHGLLIFPLILRFKQTGDRFMPLGMKNFKKLSDFLINQKVPLPLKNSIPILVNGNGDIIWVAGMRLDDRYKVNATTKKVTIFELSNQ